jgi:hypothetical protein
VRTSSLEGVVDLGLVEQLGMLRLAALLSERLPRLVPLVRTIINYRSYHERGDDAFLYIKKGASSRGLT